MCHDLGIARVNVPILWTAEAKRSSRPILHLGVSDGFTYDLATTIDGGDCTSVTVSNMMLGVNPIVAGTIYMVTVNGFLADGIHDARLARRISA